MRPVHRFGKAALKPSAAILLSHEVFRPAWFPALPAESLVSTCGAADEVSERKALRLGESDESDSLFHWGRGSSGHIRQSVTYAPG